MRSLISSGPFLHADSKDSDQTGRMLYCQFNQLSSGVILLKSVQAKQHAVKVFPYFRIHVWEFEDSWLIGGTV